MNLVFIRVVQFLVGTLAAVSSAISIYQSTSDDTNYTIAIISIILLCIAIYTFKYITVKKRYQDKLCAVARDSHKFNHELRNAITRIEQLGDKFTDNGDTLIELVRDVCEKNIDYLSDSLSRVLNKDICVHLKHIPEKNELKDLKSVGLKTFCSCSNTKKLPNRHTINTHLVKDNVPYQDLFIKRKPHCYYPNFRKKAKLHLKVTGNPFIINNNKVDEYYGSVAYVAVKLIEGENCDIRGILVADYYKKNVFKRRDELLITEIMKSYADGFYLYLTKFNNLEREISKK
ncbi:MAG: hypothetical protein MI810_01950 [Flavobacteriales bacterium]|nr:hypothetical protein [Flavobacteriales bacterium]